METFDFETLRPYAYTPFTDTTITEGDVGNTFSQAEYGTGLRYGARFTVRIPGNDKTLVHWVDHVLAVKGASEIFKFEDILLSRFNVSTLEALGTGNASNTDFALDYKYVKAATLLVYKDGVLQTSGYTLVGNDSAPLVRFTVAPTLGVVITATYSFYIPVRYRADPPLGGVVGDGLTLDAEVEVVEEYPDARKV